MTCRHAWTPPGAPSPYRRFRSCARCVCSCPAAKRAVRATRGRGLFFSDSFFLVGACSALPVVLDADRRTTGVVVCVELHVSNAEAAVVHTLSTKLLNTTFKSLSQLFLSLCVDNVAELVAGCEQVGLAFFALVSLAGPCAVGRRISRRSGWTRQRQGAIISFCFFAQQRVAFDRPLQIYLKWSNPNHPPTVGEHEKCALQHITWILPHAHSRLLDMVRDGLFLGCGSSFREPYSPVCRSCHARCRRLSNAPNGHACVTPVAYRFHGWVDRVLSDLEGTTRVMDLLPL